MTAIRFVALVLAASCASLAGPRPEAAAQTGVAIARVAALEGAAVVERFGSTQQLPLAVQAPLYRADTVYTRAGSRIRIAFDDETVITLSELGSLRITQIPEPRQAATSRLTVLAGTARFAVKPAPGRAPVEMWSHTAVAAVRGTEYIAEITPDVTALVVLSGVVAVSNYRPDIRGTVTLRAGEGTTVPLGQGPAAPTRWGEARRRAFEDRTRLP